MKKALMIASMASMLDNFNMYNIELLHELGYELTLAANFKTEDSNSQERVERFKNYLNKKGYYIEHIDFTRRILNVKGLLKSYRQVKKMSKGDFELVHCHSPICAAMTRMAFRKKKKDVRIIYTAHGFHFYKGAPLKNWLFYFPIEWICSYWTDVLITINQEDFRCAKKYLKAKKIKYIPSVGIDLRKFCFGTVDRKEKRKSLQLENDDIMLLSVGELSKRKNQAIVIKAIKRMEDPRLKYFICGIGALEAEYRTMVKELGLDKQVFFLGYREDISELCQAADLFVFPSLQEGLPVALMEAIAVKTPVICSAVRGNIELVSEREFLFDPSGEETVIWCIENAINSNMLDIVEKHYNTLKRFDINFVIKQMRNYYIEAANMF